MVLCLVQKLREFLARCNPFMDLDEPHAPDLLDPSILLVHGRPDHVLHFFVPTLPYPEFPKQKTGGQGPEGECDVPDELVDNWKVLAKGGREIQADKGQCGKYHETGQCGSYRASRQPVPVVPFMGCECCHHRRLAESPCPCGPDSARMAVSSASPVQRASFRKILYRGDTPKRPCGGSIPGTRTVRGANPFPRPAGLKNLCRSSNAADHSTLMFWRWAPGALGMTNSKMPSLNVALALSPSTWPGSRMLRWNSPRLISRRW